ncbi:hypothetical protein D3C71_1966830 [compost metagenome]
MAKLAKRLGLDLTNTLTGNAENLAHFLKRSCTSIIQTEAKTQYILFSLSQCIKHIFKLFL